MSKVLITGGAGFIGSAVSKYFQKKGWKVKIFDLVARPINSSAEYVRASIMYSEEIYDALKGCDHLVHLAAMLGVARTEKERLKCLDVNIQGTRNVFDAAVKAGVKKIVFTSSSEVYGEPLKTPIRETDPVFPKSVYAVTKLAGEEYVKAYSQRFGVKYSIVRLFNVYGREQVAQFVMSRFIKSAMEGKPLAIYGKGEQIRSFCHVDDAAQGIFRALTNKEGNSEIFNIGNDKEPIMIKGLAKRVVELSKKNSEMIFVEMEDSDRLSEREIARRIPDIGKARRILKYEPKIELSDGILNVISESSNKKIRENWPKEK